MTKPLSTLDSSMAERELSKAQTGRSWWWVAIAVIIIALPYQLIQGGSGVTMLGLIIPLVIGFFKIRRLNARIEELKKATPQSS